jgi:hypothetical protein
MSPDEEDKDHAGTAHVHDHEDPTGEGRQL